MEPDDPVLAVSRILILFLTSVEERTFCVYYMLSCFSSLHSSAASRDRIALSRLLCYDLLNHSNEVIQFDWLLNANEVALFDLKSMLIQACTHDDRRDVL